MPSARSLFRCFVVAIVTASLAVVAPQAVSAVAGDSSTVFINEFHYDNASTDVGEFIEVAAPAGTNLDGWTVVLYNGSESSRSPYNTIELSGTVIDAAGGYGFVSYDTAGLQNGSPDGMALVDATGAVVQFLSYEGVFTAADGPAVGLTSTDVGVSEGSSTPIGASLHLTGSGTTAGQFSWSVTDDDTPGQVNTGQEFSGEPAPPRVVINEFDYDQAGTDTAEFVEIYNAGPGSADLAGWQLRLITGSDQTEYNAIALSGSLGAGQFLVVCANSATVPNCDVDASPDTNFLQNGDPDAIVLTDGTGATIDAVSYRGSVPGAVEGSGDGLSDDVSAARSLSRLPDGSDTNDNAADFIRSCITPGEANVDGATGCGGLVFIHDVQGSGEASPLVGRDVTIEGIVVGDFEGPSPALRGFYVQEEDVDADADPATSEAIFVFNGNNDSVNLGDQVRVTGTVGEFQFQTQISLLSELEVLSTANTVTPAIVELPLTSPDELEAVEGMLVTMPQTLYVTEMFLLGRFGQVTVSSGDRLDQPTAIAEPGPAALAVQAANDLNRIIIDDNLNNQNPDPIQLARGGQELTADNALRGGDTVSDIVGVMTYTWGGNGDSPNAFRLRPIGDLSDSGLVEGGTVPEFEPANPRPSEPPIVNGRVQVASFNVLNYFLTIDDGSNNCGPDTDEGCRGADRDRDFGFDFEFQRQRAKLLAALAKLDADVYGLVELENTPGVSPEADLAAGLNEIDGSGDWASIDAAAVGGGLVGPDVIRTGIVYNSAVVAPVGDPAILIFSRDDLGEDRSRPSVTQTFVERATGEVFTVSVNHFKSKGGSTISSLCSNNPDYADCDQGDGQGAFNDIRTTHAQELVEWLAADPTDSGDDDVILIGDLNAYGMEDPIDVLRDAGYINLPGDDSYSYVFDGQWGSLDYMFGSPSLAESVTGAGHYHINADEPTVLDYNTNFITDRHVELLYAPDEFRTSDHDPALAGLDLGPTGYEPTPTPDSLWPPNHKYRTVTVTATGGIEPMTVDILSVESSEADSGLDPEDVPNDIGTIEADTVELRAERFSSQGRTYTLYLRITDGTQTLFTTTTVTVPKNQKPKSTGGGKP